MGRSVANFPPDDELAVYRGYPERPPSVIRNERPYRKTEMDRWGTIKQPKRAAFSRMLHRLRFGIHDRCTRTWVKIFGSPTAPLDYFAKYPVHGNSSPDLAELRLQQAVRWQAHVDATGCSFGFSPGKDGVSKTDRGPKATAWRVRSSTSNPAISDCWDIHAGIKLASRDVSAIRGHESSSCRQDGFSFAQWRPATHYWPQYQ